MSSLQICCVSRYSDAYPRMQCWIIRSWGSTRPAPAWPLKTPSRHALKWGKSVASWSSSLSTSCLRKTFSLPWTLKRASCLWSCGPSSVANVSIYSFLGMNEDLRKTWGPLCSHNTNLTVNGSYALLHSMYFCFFAETKLNTWNRTLDFCEWPLDDHNPLNCFT